MTGLSLFVTAPLAWCLGACLPSAWHDRLIARQSPLSRAPSRRSEFTVEVRVVLAAAP